MGERENKVKTTIIEYLNMYGLVWNVNNGMFRGKYHMGKKGSADIQGAIWWKERMIPIQIETKTPEGKLSETQKAFRERWTEWGFFYSCTRNVEQVIKELDEYVKGVKKW